MIGARAKEHYAEQARERMRVRKGNQPGASPANLPDLGDARDQAGAAVNVSGKLIDAAAKILRDGCAEVVAAVTYRVSRSRPYWCSAGK